MFKNIFQKAVKTVQLYFDLKPGSSPEILKFLIIEAL